MGEKSYYLTGYTVSILVVITAVTFLDGWLAKKQEVATIQALSEISKLIFRVFAEKHQVTIMQLEPYFLERFTSIQLSALK